MALKPMHKVIFDSDPGWTMPSPTGFAASLPKVQVCMDVTESECLRVFEEALMSDWIK